VYKSSFFFTGSLKKLSNRVHLLVLGDFNIPGITWYIDEKTNVLLLLAHNDFTEGLFDISLSQVNYIQNSLGRTACEVSIDTGAVLEEKSEKLSKRLHVP